MRPRKKAHEWLQRKDSGLAVWNVADIGGSTDQLRYDHQGPRDPHREMMQQAIGKARRKYPSSSTRVVKEPEGRAYLVADPELVIPIRTVTRQHSRSWVEEVAAGLARPFDECNEPPLRYVWLRGDEVSEIVILCDHAFVDGYSAAYVARDLMDFLGSPESRVDPSPISTPGSALIPAFPGRRVAVWRGKLMAAVLRPYFALARKIGAQWQELKPSLRIIRKRVEPFARLQRPDMKHEPCT